MIQEIQNKIESLRKEYNFLNKASNDYILNALCVQTLFFKSPSNPLEEGNLKKIIVDGKDDGGIDCILTDTESDYNDLILMQCKCYEDITLEQVKNAINKLYSAYQQLNDKKYSYFKDDLVGQFTECNYEMEDNANVRLIFCTTSPRKGIKDKSLLSYFKSIIGDSTNIKLEFYFEKELSDIVVEYDSLRRTVSNGTILIDRTNNYLEYSEDDENEDAIIVNASANSIKELYSRHHLALFSQNLRFFVKSKTIDSDIKKSMNEYKKKFWYKNNGITIICDDFEISGREIHINGFSIINGGQTTTLIGTYDPLNEKTDFYLPVKIIRTQGDSDSDKQQFVFDIAIATNSQKAIKPADLKANEPEQILFAKELRQIGILYRTKRGEKTTSQYASKNKNLDLPKASKLGLAGIFLMPGTSRSKPSVIYSDDTSYYEGLFVKNKSIVAKTIKDLLYIDTYYDSVFKKEYQRKTTNNKRVTFANNSRTLCLAYSGFLAKLINNKFSNDELEFICNFDHKEEKDVKKVQKILSDIDKNDAIFNASAYDNLDELESDLYKIFSFICKEGTQVFESREEKTLDESSWLKKDVSFYKILANSYDDIKEQIDSEPSVYSIFKK